MSGHSKWAQIKHKKAGTDQKRGAIFSKLARLITATARGGGPNPDGNTRLRQVIDQARIAGVPKENIERAIARASGSGEDAEQLREVTYEAYGPGGSAFLISGVTDNPNRTTNEIKHLLDEYHGRLATSGSVAWLFDRKFLFSFVLPANPEELELKLIDAGAEDISITGGTTEALVSPEHATSFRVALETHGINTERSVLIATPKNAISLAESERGAVETLVASLEAHDDITEVLTNVG